MPIFKTLMHHPPSQSCFSSKSCSELNDMVIQVLSFIPGMTSNKSRLNSRELISDDAGR